MKQALMSKVYRSTSMVLIAYFLVVHKKFFARSELRRIKLGSLPCKFLKIVIHKGGYISPEQIHLVGFHAEDAGEIFGDNLFELLVANSQRLIYS
jgi:hypothetical protein